MKKMMTWAQIARKYKGEWVLLEYDQLDENLQVVRGRILAHSRNRDEVYSALLRCKKRQVALEYFGEPAKDLAVLI